jgi:hypothetical protein
MRLMEGTSAGAPIMGPAAHVIVLAFNPVWPGIAQARADMQRLAAEHPKLSFVEVSFADTQRHFGKPRDVHGIAWVLTAAGPDGRVFPEPIVRNDPRDAAPTIEQWGKLIAHASGFLGHGQVRKLVRPRRFGDLVRSMAEARRSPPITPSPRSARRTPPTMRPRKPASRRPQRRGG